MECASDIGGECEIIGDRCPPLLLIGKGDGCSDLRGFVLEHAADFGLWGFAYDDGDARFDDACFLACDGLEGVAEECGVVKSYVGDDA